MRLPATPTAPLAAEMRNNAVQRATSGITSMRTGLQGRTAPAARGRDGEDRWDVGIHDLRKCCKQVRAVARLCRDAMGQGYDRANAAFRDAARLVGDARDARTMVASIDLLGGLLADTDLEPLLLPDDDAQLVLPGDAAALRQQLGNRYRRIRQEVVTEGRDVAALDALVSATAGIDGWPLPDDLSPADLEPSITRVHRRGRRLLQVAGVTAEEEPDLSTTEWHQWRKRAKYLRHQVDLLSPAWPDVLTRWEAGLHVLTDLIGEEHDLAVLIQTIRSEALLDPAAQARVSVVVARRRTQRRDRALQIGMRLYAEESEAFARRMVDYMTAPKLQPA